MHPFHRSVRLHLICVPLLVLLCAGCADPAGPADDDGLPPSPTFTGTVQVSEIFMHMMGSSGSSAAAGFSEPGEVEGPEVLGTAGSCTVYEADAMSMGAPTGELDAGEIEVRGGSTDIDLLFTGAGL